jgi:hypothetical protein
LGWYLKVIVRLQVREVLLIVELAIAGINSASHCLFDEIYLPFEVVGRGLHAGQAQILKLWYRFRCYIEPLYVELGRLHQWDHGVRTNLSLVGEASQLQR